MTGRERFLAAMGNKKPDRLPCQVHSWMNYYLQTYLKGMDQFEAYEYFDMDPVIYVSPNYTYDKADLEKWKTKYIDFGVDSDGNKMYGFEYTTPQGKLSHRYASNKYTVWETEVLVKNEHDMELFLKYYPSVTGADWTPVRDAAKRIGFEKGNPDIIRKMVAELFDACPNGGYICSPSDHFFNGSLDNLRAFNEECKKCIY